jgi:hypothetical protein
VHWTLADGAVLELAANLAETPFLGAPASAGQPLLATAVATDGQWPPWYVQWTLER